jgi:hypothetical protein
VVLSNRDASCRCRYHPRWCWVRPVRRRDDPPIHPPPGMVRATKTSRRSVPMTRISPFRASLGTRLVVSRCPVPRRVVSATRTHQDRARSPSRLRPDRPGAAGPAQELRPDPSRSVIPSAHASAWSRRRRRASPSNRDHSAE